MSKSYLWDPEVYNQSSSEQMRWALELLSKLNLNGNEKLLDIGCGDGKVTAKIAELLHDGTVVGIDNSSEMIEYAKNKYSQSEYPNLKFHLMSADSIQYQNEFDFVFSNATLHWVKDQLAVWKGINYALKHGGKVLIQMAAKGNAQLAFDVVNKIIKQNKWSEYFVDLKNPYNFFNVVEYRIFIELSGMKVSRIELIPKDMLHKGKEGITGWIKSVWLPYTDRIPLEYKNEFIELFADEYIKINPPDENGFVHSRMLRLEAEAEKID